MINFLIGFGVLISLVLICSLLSYLLGKLKSRLLKRILTGVIISPFLLLGIHYYLLYQTIWYPLWQLDSTWMSPDTRLSATYNLYLEYDNLNSPEYIELLISNIDDFEEGRSIWGKGMKVPVSYGVDAVLDKVTGKDFGNFTDSDYIEDWQIIADKWKEWYEEEYVQSR